MLISKFHTASFVHVLLSTAMFFPQASTKERHAKVQRYRITSAASKRVRAYLGRRLSATAINIHLQVDNVGRRWVRDRARGLRKPAAGPASSADACRTGRLALRGIPLGGIYHVPWFRRPFFLMSFYVCLQECE